MEPIDAGEDNDWMRQHWDLPTNKADLIQAIHDTGITVAQFRAFPIYKRNLSRIPWLHELEDINDDEQYRRFG